MNPEWNSADPRASLLAQWDFFHDHARQLFLQDGTHVEILFLLAKDGTLQPVPIAPPMTREEVTSQLREQLPGSRVYGLIHIGEAWGYVPQGADDHTRKQLELGEMRVSSLRDEDKVELLIVSLLSRDGDSMAWIDQIVRPDGEQVQLGWSKMMSDIQFPLGNLF